MITLRRSGDRGQFDFGWLDTRYFLQIWILPGRQGLAPRYDQVAFAHADLRNRLRLIAAPSPPAILVFDLA